MPLPNADKTNAEIVKFTRLSVSHLRAEWAATFGAEPPKNAQREYLLRAITHHFQCLAHGGMPIPLQKRLDKLASSNHPSAATNTRSLQPGARILRDWKGTIHEVEVVDGGYRYKAETYKSLSVIARKITGTHWSGPSFFGLKNPKPVLNRAF